MINLINSCKPDFKIILRDFNARSKSWWQYDVTSSEGTKIDDLTSYHGLHQLISQPTHILANSSSCIDLIFTDQPNLVTDCGIHPSLHPNCHHQIIYCKLNLKIVYPPPYRRLVWDFKRASIDSIRKSIKTVDWHFMFLNKNVHEQVSISNNILLNIFSNYIPPKHITVDDRDPPWITKHIKGKINLKSMLYKSRNFTELQNLSSEISEMISARKEEYYIHLAEKLNNPSTSSKTYWKILKSFYKDSKVPLIPPLLVNNKFVSDFAAKANLFNEFFSSQCIPLSNNSVLPSNKYFLTDKRLMTIDFKKEDILKIIRKLNVNKAHGHDDISIRMLKICDSVVTEPLSILFKNCIESGIFPNVWKMSHIIPSYKKNDKCYINNYRPVSLLPICSKIFERIIYNPVFSYLENNDLLTPNQSGFRPNDSCVNQLLSIAHKIYSDFDEYPSLEVRSNFLDISKAFDKVWHEGLIFKLEIIGILPRESLITIYKSFVRPHIDYGDIIYDQPNNEQFCNMIERVQYNDALAITGAIKGTSQQKIYNKLGFESLRFRRWFRRMCAFYKIKTTQLPSYLYDLIPKSNHNYNTRNIGHLDPYYCRTDVFKYSFFPYTVIEWNKPDADLKNAKSYMF